MKPMSARELKNSTGEVVRTLRRGESILLTFRGKALATIEPLRPDSGKAPTILPYEQAWAEIESQLRRTQPRFASWREAEDQARGRQ
jgi:antitoxin (DNA-binding transcriptional repressor) of toxin-antitoxin stability system